MAGRKDKNTVDYFPHYCIGGKTMFVLESKFGHTGYSVWFKTLELLGSTENHYIDLRDETEVLFLISKLKITEQQFNDIYNLLSKLDAIDSFFWENKIIYSDNFIKNIDDAYKRRNNKCMQKLDLCKHLNILCNHEFSNLEHNYTEKSKVEYSKVNKIKEKESENYFFENDDNKFSNFEKIEYLTKVQDLLKAEFVNVSIDIIQQEARLYVAKRLTSTDTCKSFHEYADHFYNTVKSKYKKNATNKQSFTQKTEAIEGLKEGEYIHTQWVD